MSLLDRLTGDVRMMPDCPSCGEDALSDKVGRVECDSCGHVVDGGDA